MLNVTGFAKSYTQTKVRCDFSNDGTVTTSSGNDFTVAGAPAPEID